ncbi:MAG: radical SAM protein, partial [Lachnospiraceae bacterium]|nr:radical SAM protein [Lachnospiraceae bacterium]
MATVAQKLANLSHAAERQVFSVAIESFLKKLNKVEDRDEAYLKLVDAVTKFWGKDGAKKETLDAVRAAINDPDNRWKKFINRVIDETNPHVAKMTLLNLGYEAFFHGTKMIRENRVKYNCNIPWLILFDPTSACNMHCKGCWSGTYGHKSNLSFEDMDKIVTQGKELGVYLYMMTGGEPLVRKKDILRLAEKHNDVQFGIFDNSTLIDDEFCQEVVRLGNLTFMLSIEGTPDTNDSRRGIGHYDAVMNAMDLFQKYGIIFGTSICYTRTNCEAVTDEKFIRMIADKGARFGFFFHYMPVG